MNIFAWNITISNDIKIKPDFPFDFIESSKSPYRNLYIFWETDFSTSQDLLNFLSSSIWKLESYDISISTEDKIEILPYDFEDSLYEVVSFEGEWVSFEEIKNRFSEHDAIFCIREAELSKKFWNKVIKADFVY